MTRAALLASGRPDTPDIMPDELVSLIVLLIGSAMILGPLWLVDRTATQRAARRAFP